MTNRLCCGTFGVLLAVLACSAGADECSEFLDAKALHDEAFRAFLAKRPDVETAHETLLEAGERALRSSRFAHASIEDADARAILDELYFSKEILSSTEFSLARWLRTGKFTEEEKSELIDTVFGSAGKAHDGYIAMLKAACQRNDRR